MVYRVYVEKKPEFANEAKELLSELNNLVGIKNLESIRVINCYDAENISKELFEYAKKTVFSEPQTDILFEEIPLGSDASFAVEFLPGQFDQRADSAAQCIQIISQGELPLIQTAKVYLLYGKLTQAQVEECQKYVINPVESRLASLEKPKTLQKKYEAPQNVKIIEGFINFSTEELQDFLQEYALSMDEQDLIFCQKYFKAENREPTITEIRMIDTYWSDHCRHTTFLTEIDHVRFEDELLQKTYQEYLEIRKELGDKKPICLMDLATITTKYLKKNGYLEKLDESEEINACTVKIQVDVDGKEEPWLLLFKNETHNHPTEIEPFGGAATCIGGAIRDPLSGRAYVYGAMRVTGAANPLLPLDETMQGKLPQRKICKTAAAGYSSYGNQIGVATGIVDEIYHPGYAAKRMEVGAVIAATPAINVRREVPLAGDVVILLGGATGRDGCGGATGSSKSHTVESIEECGAEVQKGNAPEERKIQRFFRNKEVCKLIKRCNDFGAGGVSVAIGELADGLEIDLNAVPKKYEGLDGTELAISESQERMAVVVEVENQAEFLQLANQENLEATVVAVVTENPRLIMKWNGKEIVNVSREFLNSNGAPKHISIAPKSPEIFEKECTGNFTENYKNLVSDLNSCSKRGLAERFDSTIGAGTVLMPFGGKYQRTPTQAMVQKLPVEKGHTNTCSLMAFGYNPFISEKSPYHGAYFAVLESVSKLIASGAPWQDIYLSFQEYFENPQKDEIRWGKPLAALLGAFKAQMDFKIASIGGKDSMSGSFEDLDVPPTLVSFAVTTTNVEKIVSPECKKAGNKLVLLQAEMQDEGLPNVDSFLKICNQVTELLNTKQAKACYVPGIGGIADAVFKMLIGNEIGFIYKEDISIQDIFAQTPATFILEVEQNSTVGMTLGTLIEDKKIVYKKEEITLEELMEISESKLETIYSCNKGNEKSEQENFSYSVNDWVAATVKIAKPTVLIPVFPGTNCEYDSAKAIRDVGANPEILVINTRSSEGIERSIEKFAQMLKKSQMIFLPGGFSGGDEPDGSGKFITAFFRNQAIKEGVTNLLDDREGLICGICNGFQALIKLGLVPYGKIIDMDEKCPTLALNSIGRHQSKIVNTRISSNKSPWLSLTKVGEIYQVPISHGEGRFVASDELIEQMARNGQIATQYVDLQGNATDDIQYNPNNSKFSIEGITSPDGRVFGKMGHSERVGNGLYKNVMGNYDIKMFEAAVKYFQK